METYLLQNSDGNTIEITGDCVFEGDEITYIWSCEELDECFHGIWSYSYGPVNPTKALRWCKGYKLVH